MPQINQFSPHSRKKFCLDMPLDEQVGSEVESPRRGLLLCHIKSACRADLCAAMQKTDWALAQAIIKSDADGLNRTEPFYLN